MSNHGKGKVDKEAKLAALMMSGLMMTAPDELDDFRRRRLGKDSQAELGRLQQARALALWIAEAITSDDEPKWAQLEATWRSLLKPAPDDDEPTTVNATALQQKAAKDGGALPDSQGTSLLVDPAAAVEAAEAVLPFAKPLPTQPEPQLDPGELAEMSVGSPPLTLAQYAALCAACGAQPERVDETHAKFGLADAAARDELDLAWHQHFDADPRARELWQMLFRRFRAWLVQYGTV